MTLALTNLNVTAGKKQVEKIIFQRDADRMDNNNYGYNHQISVDWNN